MALKIVFPWPDRALSPNARVHWSQRAKAAKAARQQAGALALAAGAKTAMPPAGPLHLYIDFYPPDSRCRDDDNLAASFKSARDGIADALGGDDRRFVSHPLVRQEVRKGGQVVVTIIGGPQ